MRKAERPAIRAHELSCIRAIERMGTGPAKETTMNKINFLVVGGVLGWADSVVGCNA